MKTLRYWAMAVAALACNFATAQINMSTYVPAEQLTGFDANVATLLDNKLQNTLSKNGMTTQMGDSRFVLAATLSVVEKEAIATTPPKVVVHLNLHLAVGDVGEGKCWGSRSVDITGVGATDNQAVTNAVKLINAKKIAEVGELLQLARQRIIDYYNENGPTIIATAKVKAEARDYDEAIYMLAQFPQECNGYQEAINVMQDTYIAYINFENAALLQEAKAMWTSNPSCANAAEVAELLGSIDVLSTSVEAADELLAAIQSQCQLEAERRHAIKMQKMADEAALKKSVVDGCVSVANGFSSFLSKKTSLFSWF